ncbi:MAG: hypothetical protein ACRDOA_13575 [Streptosporangiaceae bacterium]
MKPSAAPGGVKQNLSQPLTALDPELAGRSQPPVRQGPDWCHGI